MDDAGRGGIDLEVAGITASSSSFAVVHSASASSPSGGPGLPLSPGVAGQGGGAGFSSHIPIAEATMYNSEVSSLEKTHLHN